VHSNAVGNGLVLSTKPAANSKVEPGSEVTLTVARNTAPADLIATAAKATWTNGAGNKLAFPGKAEDNTGLVQQRTAELDARAIVKVIVTVLETNPQTTRSITGVYKLAEPVVPGDHVRAQVGLLKPKEAGGLQGTDNPPGTGDTFTFVVRANGKDIKKVTTDGKLTELDADLSAVKDTTSIEIAVEGPNPTQGWVPVWLNPRLEPRIG